MNRPDVAALARADQEAAAWRDLDLPYATDRRVVFTPGFTVAVCVVAFSVGVLIGLAVGSLT